MSEQKQPGAWRLRHDEENDEIWVVRDVRPGAWIGYFVGKSAGMSWEQYEQYMRKVRDKLNEKNIDVRDPDGVWNTFGTVKL